MAKSLLLNRILVFILTFMSYASMHGCRSVWSYSKESIKIDPFYNYSSSYFGTCDFIFLLCYSLSLYIFSWIGDKIDLRIFFSIGVLGSSISFGSLAIMRINNYENQTLFLVLMGINGAFQSVGWPACIAIMTNWFLPKKRGMIMGIWSGNPNIGNIFGYEFGAVVIDQLGLSWTYAILSSIIFLLFWSILLNLFVYPYPEKIGFKIYSNNNEIILNDPSTNINSNNNIENNNSNITTTYNLDETNINMLNTVPLIERNLNEIHVSNNENNQPLGFFRALLLPGVIIYSIGFACTKATSYGLLFWLSSYLKEHNMENDAARISQTNDIGQFLGGFILGIMNDKFNKKAFFMPIFLILATISFILVRFVAGENVLNYYILIFFCGFFLGGPFNIVSSAISADLGKNPLIKGNKKAQSTVTGIIEGTGSLGAALIQKLIPIIESQIFLLLALLCLLAAVIVSPTAYKEFKVKLFDHKNIKQ